ncbi:hypothetical protein HDV57DRAFT_53415 [Trichoderma longibrachiatum]
MDMAWAQVHGKGRRWVGPGAGIARASGDEQPWSPPYDPLRASLRPSWAVVQVAQTSRYSNNAVLPRPLRVSAPSPSSSQRQRVPPDKARARESSGDMPTCHQTGPRPSTRTCAHACCPSPAQASRSSPSTEGRLSHWIELRLSAATCSLPYAASRPSATLWMRRASYPDARLAHRLCLGDARKSTRPLAIPTFGCAIGTRTRLRSTTPRQKLILG